MYECVGVLTYVYKSHLDHIHIQTCVFTNHDDFKYFRFSELLFHNIPFVVYSYISVKLNDCVVLFMLLSAHQPGNDAMLSFRSPAAGLQERSPVYGLY